MFALLVHVSSLCISHPPPNFDFQLPHLPTTPAFFSHCRLKFNLFLCVCLFSSHVHRAVLGPLLELPPPAQSLMLVVDSLDVGYGTGEGGGKSGSIAELLAANQHLLPGWLLLVCSVRRHNKAICKMFSGMKKKELILKGVALLHIICI